MKTIHVTIKNNYGREAIYPACSDSESFARIAGTRTLTREVLTIIKGLGYTVEVKQPELSI